MNNSPLNLEKIEREEQRRNFKKSLVWAAISTFFLIAHFLTAPSTAQAQTLTSGACVMGSNMVKSGRLVFTHEIKVYASATDKEHKTTMTYHDVYQVASPVPPVGRVKLVYAAGLDNNPEAGKVFGWVDRKDLVAYDQRNCD